MVKTEGNDSIVVKSDKKHSWKYILNIYLLLFFIIILFVSIPNPTNKKVKKIARLLSNFDSNFRKFGDHFLLQLANNLMIAQPESHLHIISNNKDKT